MKKVRKIVVLAIIMGAITSSIIACSVSDVKVDSFNSDKNTVELQTSIADAYGNADAIVTIVSDDGFYDSCVNLNRVFSERGLKCTVAGAIFIVEPFKDNWDKLIKDGTIDLVSHSYNHIRMEDGREIAQDVDALTHEIVDADKWYENWLGYEQIVFVCPENQMCQLGYKILRENGFWSVRRGYRGYNSLSPEEGVKEGQWFNLMVQGICDEGVDLNVRNSWIDTAINDGTWLIEMWHNVMPEKDGAYQTILISDAEEHLDYIAKKVADEEVWVATYTEAVKYIREKQNIDVKAYINGNKLYIMSELTDDNMSYTTFNQPLTVFITLPDEYKVNGNKIICSSEGELMINIVPGEKRIIDLVGE